MRLLMADKGQRQRQRRDDHQALVAAAKHGVEADQHQREQDDGGPARLERLQEEVDACRQKSPRTIQFDGEHQDGGGKQRDQAVADDRPSAPRQVAGGRIVFQELWRGTGRALPDPCHVIFPGPSNASFNCVTVSVMVTVTKS